MFLYFSLVASCDPATQLTLSGQASIQADSQGNFQLLGAPELAPYFRYQPPSAAYPQGLCLLELGAHGLLLAPGSSLRLDSRAAAPALLIRSSFAFELAEGALLAGSARDAAGAWRIEAHSIALGGAIRHQTLGAEAALLSLQLVAGAALSSSEASRIELEAPRAGFGSLLLESVTDAFGQATFELQSDLEGEDLIEADFTTPEGYAQRSGLAHIFWGRSWNAPVRIGVRDPQGARDEQAFEIRVQPDCDPPQITSSPVLQALEDQPYSYQVQASGLGADGQYQLFRAPAGMTIDPQTGLIEWIPRFPYIRDVLIGVRAGFPWYANQTFILHVQPRFNLLPVIHSTPPSAELVTQHDFRYQLRFTDPEGDFGDLTFVQGVFNGIKPAVLAIVMFAAWRIGSRALKNPLLWALAAASFIAIFAFRVPFPYIVLMAGIFGFIGGKLAPDRFRLGSGHGRSDKNYGPALIDDDTPPLPHTSFSWTYLLSLLAVALTLWAGAMALLSDPVLREMGAFFTKTALVTFGGAYAVLPYVYQGSVEKYGWLTGSQMIDGLALGKTTPGPLIMVVSFVGFVGTWTKEIFGPDIKLLAGFVGASVAAFFTFLPSFVFILAGAPLVESTHDDLKFTAPLTGITAAVVGVLLNLALFFAWHLFFPNATETAPFTGGLDWFYALVSLLALTALWRFKQDGLKVIAACAVIGLLHAYLL